MHKPIGIIMYEKSKSSVPIMIVSQSYFFPLQQHGIKSTNFLSQKTAG